RAAWELMKFLTSEEAFNVITARMGYLPLRTTIVNDPALLQTWVRENPQILPNLQQLEFLEPSLAFPGDNHVQIRDIYLRTKQQILLSGADPESTLRESQQRAQALMPRR
ncbi:MAG: ABC transporter substrate-binding protein, partial [Dehalococcoidia bacterium]|nr:ABC transporter substrate-binding protein [Dehalococcoidia bacterium]